MKLVIGQKYEVTYKCETVRKTVKVVGEYVGNDNGLDYFKNSNGSYDKLELDYIEDYKVKSI